MAFAGWFRSELEKRLGETSPETVGVAGLIERLGLPRGMRETIRRVLREGHEPTQQVQQRIRDAMAALAVSGTQVAATGVETRRSLEPFFGANPEFGFGDTPHGSDITLVSKSGGITRLIRCIEDDSDSSVAPDDYFVPHVLAAREKIAGGVYDIVTLVSHRRSSPEVRALAGKGEMSAHARIPANRVEVMCIGDIVGRYFDLDRCRAQIDHWLRDAGVGNGNLPLPISGKDLVASEEIKDCFDVVCALIDSSQPVVCALLGEFGSGKSTLCYRVARHLLKQARLDASRLPLPVIVNAKLVANATDILRNIEDSIEALYGHDLHPDLIRNLLARGDLVVFFDGLDESRALIQTPALQRFLDDLPERLHGRPKYFITARREMFISSEVEAWIFGRSEVQRIELQCLAEDVAERAFFDRLKPGKAQLLSQQADAIAPLRELMRRPLFLRYISEISEDATFWHDVATTAHELGHITSLIYRIFEAYTQQWISREQARELPQELMVSADDRKSFCERLAVLVFESPSNSEEVPIEDLRAETVRYYSDSRGSPLSEVSYSFEKFLLDARLSMFLVRDAESDTFRFAHRTIETFFLARAIGKELLDSSGSLPTLSRAPLRKERSLLPIFIFGQLLNTREPHRMSSPQVMGRPSEAIASWIDRFRGSAVFDRPTVTVSRYLLPNLVSLKLGLDRCARREPQCDLSGLYLPLADFESFVWRIGDQDEPIVLDPGNANIEFARVTRSAEFESGHGVIRALLSQQALSHCAEEDEAEIPNTRDKRLARIPELLQYCWKNGILEENSLCDGRRDDWENDEGCRWVLVPGGRWSLGKYRGEQREVKNSQHRDRLPADDDLAYESRLAGAVDVLLPSFLMQQHPVTNREFLCFVKNESRWMPAHQRAATRNDYYLDGWEGVEEELKGNLENWPLKRLLEELSKTHSDWLNAPVIYVSWSAANAYAQHYGLSLPTEAEFEAAARMHQPDDLVGAGQSECSAWDFPWGDLAAHEEKYTSDGYFFYRANSGHDAKLIPFWDCTVADPAAGGTGDLAKFAAWVKNNSIAARPGLELDNTVYHLVGGIREWTSCVWHRDWPLDAEGPTRTGAWVAPRNDGLVYDTDLSARIEHPTLLRNDQDGPSLHRVLRPADEASYYALRGGSFHKPRSECRISYRAPQRRTNVNPDAGFRCIRRLVPR